MCSILGFASATQIIHKDKVTMGNKAMCHRGPDYSGEWWSCDGRVGLGHNRLSIFDLSSAGNQPMWDPLGENCIVFNGEIYNFRDIRNELISRGCFFHTNSDTEVILAAYKEWGESCLEKFNGMFALAIYDSHRAQIFLARDRVGEKPLFYAFTEGVFRFASELKGLMADETFPRKLDIAALDSYLLEGFVSGGRSMLQGVNKLPPAHTLIFRLNDSSLSIKRYWSPPALSSESRNESELLAGLGGLLEDAIKKQLVADVPVGVLLSGGVDSSLITALAARSVSRVKTFTIRFPGYGKYDESKHARLIADHYGTEHIELEAEASTIDLLPLLARQFDEPIIDSSMVPTYLVSRLVRQHCTVALGGDGGDELFGGYNHYSQLLWLQKRARFMPKLLKYLLARGAGKLLPLGFKGRNWLQSVGVDFERDVPLIASYFDRASRELLMAEYWRGAGVAERLRKGYMPDDIDLLQSATRIDFATYLPEDILVKVDRASMLNSLEVRAPMLDFRVIEFAFGKVPSHLKATTTGRKILLKRLASRILPPQFDLQRKQGFSIPLASWLESGAWLKYFQEVLLDDGQTLFCHKFVRSLFEGQKRGRSNGERLFGLVMFELWRREYNIDV